MSPGSASGMPGGDKAKHCVGMEGVRARRGEWRCVEWKRGSVDQGKGGYVCLGGVGEVETRLRGGDTDTGYIYELVIENVGKSEVRKYGGS